MDVVSPLIAGDRKLPGIGRRAKVAHDAERRQRWQSLLPATGRYQPNTIVWLPGDLFDC
jgi:hypothetical protein